jgi:hypothetical protein
MAVGSGSSGRINQSLSELLAQLGAAQFMSGAMAENEKDLDGSADLASASGAAAANNAVTGRTRPSLVTRSWPN